MNPNIAAKGRSFKGAIAYIVHDPDQADTDERVLFTETRNLRTNDPEKAAKVMAFTALHARELKEAAGVAATGRKTDSPVYHLSLSWIPGENPTRQEMMQTAEDALRAVGFHEHEAVFAAHGDKHHLHVHVVVNRVHPVTGKTHNPKDDRKLLQGWAHQYDKARGLEWRSPDRAAKYERNPERRTHYMDQAKAANENNSRKKASRPRPQWAAEKDVIQTSSAMDQSIKERFAPRVQNLSEEQRLMNARQIEQRQALKQQQIREKAALAQRQKAGQMRAAFNKSAAGPRTLPAAKQQLETLKASQRIELRKRELADRQAAEPRKTTFTENQKKDREKFLKNDRLQTKLENHYLNLVRSTPVGQQDANYKGHLSKVFNRDTAEFSRATMHAQSQKREKAQFLKRQRIGVDRLKASQAAERRNLEARVKADASAGSIRATQREQKARLAGQQKDERGAQRLQHTRERADMQAKWKALNRDRAQAWDELRQSRQAQANEPARPAGQAHGAGAGQGGEAAKPKKSLYDRRDSFAEASKEMTTKKSLYSQRDSFSQNQSKGQGESKSSNNDKKGPSGGGGKSLSK